MKTVCTILVILVATTVHGQDVFKLDSLNLRLENAKNDTSKINALLDISNQYNNFNNAKALEFAQQAKQIALQKNLKQFEAKANMAIGHIAIYQGDYKNASTHLFHALKYYEEVKDPAGLISVNNNLGATYDRLGEFDKALEHYFKAQELLNTSTVAQEKKSSLPAIYNNIGNIYQSKGDPKSALEYYEKGLALALAMPLHRVRGQLYNNIGKLYLLDFDQSEKAREYLTEGLKVRESLGEKSEIARSLVILCDYYFRQHDNIKAKELAIRAVNLGKETGSLDVQKTSYDRLTEIEESMGNFPAALAAHREYKKLNDSILAQEAASEITKLQLQYDFDKMEKVREEEKRETTLRYLLTIGVLSVLLIIAVLITVIVRSRARQTELKRKNLAQDVENKNKELTTNVMYLIRKNELLNSVAERLLKFEEKVSPENKKLMQDIIFDLQREADTDSWKEFELRFNQVHSEFYRNLRKQYPGLSPAEEKLCAFLRLNMTSKEIAAITQQSTKSVEVARARLRKKLNLTNTNSNLVTHLSHL